LEKLEIKMKILILGITLLAVSYAAAGDIPEPADADNAANELPPPPQIPLQLPLLATVPWQPAVRALVDTPALIRAASKKHRVPAAFIKSIVAAESNFDVLAVSSKGAIGLMQLMPATAQLFGDDAGIPEQNVDAGAHYLRVLIDRYHKYRNWMNRVIAAYNAGPGAVDRYRGVPPYKETRTYVARVLGYLALFRHEPA
jgi:soluble lytic murein transglycosylase-like protein